MRRILVAFTFAALLGVVWTTGCAAPPSSSADSASARRDRLLDDQTALLDPDAARRIRAYLGWVEERYGIDYHVVLASAGDVPIEEHARALFLERHAEGASTGRALLLLVDPEARSVRVEVGYALEPYVTDAAASRLLSDYLAPRSGEGVTSAAIEASIEALVEALRPHLEPAGAVVSADETLPDEPRSIEVTPRQRDFPSGGGGSSLDLLRDLPSDGLTAEVRDRLRTIVVPQPEPRPCRDLEIALLHRGIYFQEGTLYDAAWRGAARSAEFAPSRLREIARQVDRPYEIVVEGGRAVAYYTDARELGPVFLRREAAGWIIDASAGARTIVYDYSNAGWYARDDGSPYLPLLLRSLPLRRVALAGGGAAWTRE